MIKRIILNALLLLMSGAGITLAADASFDVANVDKDFFRRGKCVVVPPSVTEKYEYYEISGDCEKDLRGQMRQNGVTWNDGKKYQSLTIWHVTWDYDYDRTPQACVADSFRAKVEIIFRYPRWVRSDAAAPSLVEKWDEYMRHLTVHENGHRDMAVAAAAELSRAVAALPPATTCAELDRRVRALCRVRMQKLSEDERGYDETTGHGKTQGAVFP